MHDITLSVWNGFFTQEQCEGFARAGLSVEWIGNRTPESPRPRLKKLLTRWLRPGEKKNQFPFTVGHRDYLSTAWLYAGGMCPIIKQHPVWIQLKERESMRWFEFFSRCHNLHSRMLWCLPPGMNRHLILQAKKKNIPILVDAEIGHQRLFQEISLQESRKAKMPISERLLESWSRRCEWEYENADWITAGSSFVKKTLVERGIPAEKIVVNNYGVDGARWTASYENRCASEEKMIFIYVAGIDSRKGIHYLVEAWRQANLPDAELWIAGGDRKKVENICGALPEGVKVLGRLTHAQMQEVYSQVHIYCLPSLLEGLARSGVEAMAAGLPLLITEETGLTDFCKDGVHGWVVPSRSVEALIEKLRWCREHPAEVKAAGDAAFAVGSKQTFESYGDRCAEIAKAIIAGRNPTAF